MKRDPYKHKEQYCSWKIGVRNGIPGISKKNSELILRYIGDMEVGRNVSSRSTRGPRSFLVSGLKCANANLKTSIYNLYRILGLIF